MVSRTDRSAFAKWLWTIDHYMLVGVIVLMASGIVLLLAASPPVAERIGLEPFFFVKRQAIYIIPSLIVMLGISALSPRLVRRLSLLIFLGGLVLMIATLFMGTEIKGAQRWITLFGVSIQASEFIKPSLIVLVAFLMSEGRRREDVPGIFASIILYVVVVALLIAQPDFGQTTLITIVLFAMLFLNGLSWFAIIPLIGTGVGGIAAGYTFLPHVRNRITSFLDPASGDTYQVDKAIDSFLAGGWFGRGVGEGTVKRILPDSHADFIFAVAAEEYGVIICVMLVSVFAFVVLRGLSSALRDQDPFSQLAVSGLVVMFGLQSCINMAVNLNLMPAKGMTLPFISYGGSSLMAVGMTMGFVLALSRRRPQPRNTSSRVTVSRIAPSSMA